MPKKKPKEKKIKVIEEAPAKIKEVKEGEEEGSDLEEEIEEEGEEQFQQFISSGRLGLPVLESGQAPPQEAPGRREIQPAAPEEPEEGRSPYEVRSATSEESERKYEAILIRGEQPTTSAPSPSASLEASRRLLAGRSVARERIKPKGVAEEEEKARKYEAGEKRRGKRYAWEA
jgi:hypothetical protein